LCSGHNSFGHWHLPCYALNAGNKASDLPLTVRPSSLNRPVGSSSTRVVLLPFGQEPFSTDGRILASDQVSKAAAGLKPFTEVVVVGRVPAVYLASCLAPRPQRT
jgi:hypothetical protein